MFDVWCSCGLCVWRVVNNDEGDVFRLLCGVFVLPRLGVLFV